MIKTYVIIPEKLHSEIEAHQVVLPGVEGEFGLLPGHIDFSSNLVDGKVRFLDKNEKQIKAIKVKNAICEFSNDICRLIAKSIS
jgi:F-type H+-transporting ATPase subunit epsilon